MDITLLRLINDGLVEKIQVSILVLMDITLLQYSKNIKRKI